MTGLLGMQALISGATAVGTATLAVDPIDFAYLARTCIRLLALNISFIVRFLHLLMI